MTALLRPSPAALLVASLTFAAPLSAQDASLVYLLGRDTVAIEQWQRTATGLTGQMVYRGGAVVANVRYAITVGPNGRPTSATVASRLADGRVPPGGANEIRLSFGADSVVRETVFADSTVRRAVSARGALFGLPGFVYGPTELLVALRRRGVATDSLPAVGASGGAGFTGLEPITPTSGEAAFRLRGVPAAVALRFDEQGRLLSVDGSQTRNKAMATRGPGGHNLDAIARAMIPVGTFSGRDVARAAFGRGEIVLVDYGRPRVRERTVWGGTLIQQDSIWRAGANEATHLFTTHSLTFADATIPAGSYTLRVQHTATGPWLIVNRQVGQWGTEYDAQQDVARVRMTLTPTAEHVEEFTITVRASGATGRLELAWGDSVAAVGFGVRAAGR